MATLKACDRCGHQTAEEETRRWVDVAVYFPHRDDTETAVVTELCPDCHKHLKDFLANTARTAFDGRCG